MKPETTIEALIALSYYCVLIEIYCGVQIIKRMKQIADMHTEKRRKAYRDKAYADKEKESTIKKNRSEIWERVTK